MKLGDVRDGVVYCTRGRHIGTWEPRRGFERRGTLPTPNAGLRQLPFVALNSRLTKGALRSITGWYTTSNVWPVGEESLLASSGRWMFYSGDDGCSWRPVHELPASSGLMGVLPTSVVEHDGRVYLAEYSLGEEDARVLVSDDDGRSWSTFLTRSDFRHFHGLFRDPYTGRLWGTTGDTDSESAIGVFEDGRFEPIGRGSQRWRAVDLTFTPTAVLWGMDCSFADRVELLRLRRDQLDEASPVPETVGTTDNSVFYAETLSSTDDAWVVVTTAAETGIDSSAPPGEERRARARAVRVLTASASSDFEIWYELQTFARRTMLGERIDRIPASGAYAFIAESPEHEVLVNPYNTVRNHGAITRIPPATFESLGASRSVAEAEVVG